MSFFRHGKIYRSDLRSMELNSSSMDDHRYDESSTGYSLTGCSPAEPLSASPIFYSFSLYPAAVYSSAANANLSLLPLSHRKGAPHSGKTSIIRALRMLGQRAFAETHSKLRDTWSWI